MPGRLYSSFSFFASSSFSFQMIRHLAVLSHGLYTYLLSFVILFGGTGVNLAQFIYFFFLYFI